MSILSLLAEHHDKWISVVRNFGANEAFCEDIVQDTYLKIAQMKNPDKIRYKETEVNHWYMVLALQSTFIDSVRKKKELCRESLTSEAREVLDMEKEEAFERLYTKTLRFISEIDRYSDILSQIYFKTDYSIRGISEMSGIGPSSIYNSIKKIREDVQNELGEDYEDFLNGDYDKI